MLRTTFLAIFLLSLLGAATAQTDSIPAGPRPKLGLALSGGGAKGLAHIGVLEVLEQNGIYADMISGTSMGSVVGGLYSIGYSPEQLVDVALSVDWSDYFNDAYPRAYQPIEERGRAARYQLSFNIQKGKLTLPQGLLQGRKIQALLASLTAPVHDIDKFDKFPKPFAAVATNIETGEAYVFHTGDLRRAIRASMAIPSVFSPVEVDGNLLVDGLVVRNLPVSDAFDLGADVVVGVDVGSPLAKKDELELAALHRRANGFLRRGHLHQGTAQVGRLSHRTAPERLLHARLRPRRQHRRGGPRRRAAVAARLGSCARFPGRPPAHAPARPR